MRRVLPFIIAGLVGAWLVMILPIVPKTATETDAAVDDAPSGHGYYAYIRFDADTGPFADRDLPAVYLDKAPRQTACFSGRVGGETRHIVVERVDGVVSTSEPAEQPDWIASACDDALKFGSKVLTTREYLQTRLQLLPDGPAYAAERAAFQAQLKTLKPWWWLHS